MDAGRGYWMKRVLEPGMQGPKVVGEGLLGDASWVSLDGLFSQKQKKKKKKYTDKFGPGELCSSWLTSDVL